MDLGVKPHGMVVFHREFKSFSIKKLFVYTVVEIKI